MFFQHLKFSIFFSLLLVIISCKKEEGPDSEEPAPEIPRIQVNVNGAVDIAALTVDVGDTLLFSASGSASAFIKTFEGYMTIDGSRETLFQLLGDSASTEISVDSMEYVFDFDLSGKEVSFLFILKDHLDQRDSARFVVTVNESPIILRHETLGTYNHASLGNFYNILADTAYFPNNLKTSVSNQEGVDFILSFDSETKFSISSPDDPDAPTVWSKHVNFQWPFQTRNKTRFIVLENTFDFDGIITSAQLSDVFSTSGVTSVPTIAEGQFIAIKLDRSRNEKIGVLKITDLTGNTMDNRAVSFTLKIQK